MTTARGSRPRTRSGSSTGSAGADWTPGAADVADLDKKLAALLGTDAAQVTIADVVVHPRTRNVYVAAMRGTGPSAAPALVRLDGADTSLLHALDAPREQIASGMRVRIRWAEPTTGLIQDIACFEPIGEQQ